MFTPCGNETSNSQLHVYGICGVERKVAKEICGIISCVVLKGGIIYQFRSDASKTSAEIDVFGQVVFLYIDMDKTTH